MAECQQNKRDQEFHHTPSDHNLPEEDYLVPLTLPPGVTSDIAARLTTSILLRRAYCSSRPWDQWLLLASLKILHGQATPLLDSVSLHLLQGTPSEKSTKCDFTDPDTLLTEKQVKGTAVSIERKNSAVQNIISDNDDQVEINHNSLKCKHAEGKSLVRPTLQRKSSLENTLSQASKTPKDCYTTDAKNTVEHSCKASKENNKNESQTPALSCASAKGYDLCEDNNSQKLCSLPLQKNHQNSDENLVEFSQICHKKYGSGEDKELREISHTCHKKDYFTKNRIPRETHLSCKKSPKDIKISQRHASVQVTPKKLGIYTTKWVQVRLPRRSEQGVQTEHFYAEARQIENSGTQSHFQEHVGPLSLTYIDKEVQTVMITKKDKSTQVECKSKTESQPSCPVWKIVSMSGIPRRQKHWAHGCKSEVKDWDGTQKTNNYKSLSESLDDNKAESDEKKGVRLFHGRPMLKKVMDPVDIPIDCQAGPNDPALLDPRLSLLS